MAQTYKTARHPKTKLWYIIGNCGGGYWMPVSEGFKSKREAELEIPRKLMIDRASARCLEGI
jgi:hypothetical protein